MIRTHLTWRDWCIGIGLAKLNYSEYKLVLNIYIGPVTVYIYL